MFNIAIIGCGNWAKVVENNLNKRKDLKCKYIVCRNRKKFHNFNNLVKYENFRDLMINKDIHGFYVAADPETNLILAEEASIFKIPIILEKPLSKNYKDAKKILELAENKKTTIMVNQSHLYNPKFNKFYDLIKQKSKIKKIYIIEGGYGPFRKNIHPVWDWGVHPISTLLKIANSFPNTINKVDVIKKKNKNGLGIVSRFHFIFDNGIKSKILTGNLFKKKIRIVKVFFNDNSSYDFNFIDESSRHTVNKRVSKINLFLKDNLSSMEKLLTNFSNNISKGINNYDLDVLRTSIKSEKILDELF